MYAGAYHCPHVCKSRQPAHSPLPVIFSHYMDGDSLLPIRKVYKDFPLVLVQGLCLVCVCVVVAGFCLGGGGIRNYKSSCNTEISHSIGRGIQEHG